MSGLEIKDGTSSMKRFGTYLLAAFVAIAACSCEREIDNVSVSVKSVIANTDNNITKTALESLSVVWENKDAITVFDNSSASHTSNALDLAETSSNVTFSVPGMSSTDQVIAAVYPADDAASFDGTNIITTFPSSQSAKDGSFGTGANVAVADVETVSGLQFKNVGGILALGITSDVADEITSVEISANEMMAGPVKINAANQTVTANGDGSKSVTINGTFVSGGKYYFAVLPGTYTGLTITFTRSNGMTATYTNSNTLTVSRNGNTSIGNISIAQTKWQYVFNFTSPVVNWPTSSANSAVGSYTYGLGTDDFVFSLSKNASGVYVNSYNGISYLMVTSSEFIGLPAISGKKLTKVGIHNSSACSQSTVVDVVSNPITAKSVTAEGETTFAERDSDYSFTLPKSYANKSYFIRVSNKNCQIESLSLMYEDSSEEFVPAPLVMSDVTCTAVGTTYLTFAWDSVLGATGYAISVNGEDKGIISTNSYSIENLSPNTEYTISVIAKGDGSDYLDSSNSGICKETTKEQSALEKGSTYVWSLVSGDLGTTGSPAGSVSKGTPSMTWSIDYAWGIGATQYFGSDANKGIQIGAGSDANKCISAVFSSSSYSGGVATIVVNASHASSGGASISVAVGGEKMKCNGSDVVACSTTATEYTFTSSALLSGEIVITISNSKAKAIYLKSISINPLYE